MDIMCKTFDGLFAKVKNRVFYSLLSVVWLLQHRHLQHAPINLNATNKTTNTAAKKRFGFLTTKCDWIDGRAGRSQSGGSFGWFQKVGSVGRSQSGASVGKNVGGVG